MLPKPLLHGVLHNAESLPPSQRHPNQAFSARRRCCTPPGRRRGRRPCRRDIPRPPARECRLRGGRGTGTGFVHATADSTAATSATTARKASWLHEAGQRGERAPVAGARGRAARPHERHLLGERRGHRGLGLGERRRGSRRRNGRRGERDGPAHGVEVGEEIVPGEAARRLADALFSQSGVTRTARRRRPRDAEGREGLQVSVPMRPQVMIWHALGVRAHDGDVGRVVARRSRCSGRWRDRGVDVPDEAVRARDRVDVAVGQRSQSFRLPNAKSANITSCWLVASTWM